MAASRIEGITREIQDLLEQWHWAGPEDRVRILVRYMDLQDLLHDLRESERRTGRAASSEKRKIRGKRP